MKKIITILLVLALVLGYFTFFHKGKEENEVSDIRDPKTYVRLMKEYAPREKSSSTTDDHSFEEFLDRTFKDLISQDYANMHFNVTDYKAMGIEKAEVTLGECTYELDEEVFDENYAILEELHSFDYNKLSRRQQYDYEALEYSMYETMADLAFWKYKQCFTMNNCDPEDLATIFSDFSFYDEESVEDYLILLKDIERYLGDAITYTEAQIKDGIRISDDSIDYVIDFTDRFTSKREDNVLITTFNDRIDELDFLSEDQKEEYKKENEKLVLNSVLPAYDKITPFIEQYYGSAKNEELILSKVNKDYADVYYMINTSSNDDIDVIWAMLKDSLNARVDTLFNVLMSEEGYETVIGALDEPSGVLNVNFRETLDFLAENTKQYFPDIGAIGYDVQELDETSAAGTVKAYYWAAPIDNIDQNIIRVNPNTERGLDTYITLSHEGFPGHLYQNCYYNLTDPSPLRSLIGFNGYTEGYANYIQPYSLMMAGFDEEEAIAAEYIDYYYFDLYSIIDIGINYYGWTAKDIDTFFEETETVLQFSDDAGESLYSYLISMPGTYCRYAVGSAQIKALKDKAQSELGDNFDYVSFNEVILENGPLPFVIIKDAVNEYIEANR